MIRFVLTFLEQSQYTYYIQSECNTFNIQMYECNEDTFVKPHKNCDFRSSPFYTFPTVTYFLFRFLRNRFVYARNMKYPVPNRIVPVFNKLLSQNANIMLL